MSTEMLRYVPGQTVRTPEGRGTVVEDLRDSGLDVVAVRIGRITGHFAPSEIAIYRYEKNEEAAELLDAITTASAILQRALQSSGDFEQCARRARAGLV
jgi:hypothetical protein